MPKALIAVLFLTTAMTTMMGQACKLSGTAGWNQDLHNLIDGCSISFSSPNHEFRVEVGESGTLQLFRGHESIGKSFLIVPPATLSWSPKSDGFFVNDGQGSGMSSTFRYFRVSGEGVSEDDVFEHQAVSIFRQRMRCARASADPNVWGFGWEDNAVLLLAQATTDDSCGPADTFMSFVFTTANAVPSKVLSESQTIAKFSRLLPPNLGVARGSPMERQ